jgi:hypothetical protein
MQHTFHRTGAIRAFCALLILGVFLPFLALAQQLRIVDATTIPIEPTAYRAYYGKLSGEPHVYTFTTTEETHFTAILAVPDVPDAKTDISATLIDAKPDGFFLTGDGALVEWQRFFDTAGRDSYLAGPALDATIPPGEYRIQVSSAADDAPYVLIVSGEDTFSPLEILRRYGTVPTIKSEFFGKSAIEAYLTPLLLWPIFAILIVAALVVFVLIVLRRRRATPYVE